MSKPEGESPLPPQPTQEQILAAIDRAAGIDTAVTSGQDTTLAEAEKKLFDGDYPAADALLNSLAKREDITSRRRESARESDLHKIRKHYTAYLFLMTVLWLASVLTFVALTGLKTIITIPVFTGSETVLQRVSVNTASICGGCWGFSFELSEKVLIAFITSTTASVIGIFIIVAKWLFPPRGKDEVGTKK
jgi:hypothetical protein